jgi:hypothetical protein
MSLSMSDDRLASALSRIELAIARVEAAAQRPVAQPEDGAQFTALSSRHEALKAETRAAIADIDALISLARGEGR